MTTMTKKMMRQIKSSKPATQNTMVGLYHKTTARHTPIIVETRLGVQGQSQNRQITVLYCLTVCIHSTREWKPARDILEP